MAAELPSKSPTIVLIVEDDTLLRMCVAEIVEEAGFAVIEAADADAAMALLESRLDIALLLTDIDMPGSMNGLQLAHAVRNRWPPIKILVVSGQVRLQPFELPQDSCFLPKPYQTAALVEALCTLAPPLGHPYREPSNVH
ncbi:response regulator [Bradyrhizobium sp. AUGA SZCCT0222]|uniref:response regulator n=1 Tax=Bradyrhizobium sp. AUGA SZCCT0222 TaxID=2807668 RepID=UPI001BA86A7A|nr:response regulator [Bradyrhizobium sp. AUGA SZCCT0222]MBR1269761.1 response regulator [Bradyrhizobium sp. AUGA SZCCT0222]